MTGGHLKTHGARANRRKAKRLQAAAAVVGIYVTMVAARCLGADSAVKVVGHQEFTVRTPAGAGVLRYFSTGSLEGSRQALTAIIVLHGVLRNADVYEHSGEEAVAAAGGPSARALVITPQFLDAADARAYRLPSWTIRWTPGGWSGGEPALAPAPISSFDVLDAIVKRLADRARFPLLREIVIFGHSAGGQLAQRYAVVGGVPEIIRPSPVRVRFVVANPSSYLYFDRRRPTADGKFSLADEKACPGYNRWRYGFVNAPPYVKLTPGNYESRYVKRDVTYLLGGKDVDRRDPYLDKSCAGEAEGPYRLARGMAYADYLGQHHRGGTAQSVAVVPGVGHDGENMLKSACGVGVLFDRSRRACRPAKNV